MTQVTRLSIALCCCLLATAPALAQSVEPPRDADAMRFGWFVQVGGGAGGHDNGPFSRRLQQYTPQQANRERFVYNTETFPDVGYSVGGAFGLVLGYDIMVGLSGEKLFVPTVESITSPGSPRDVYDLSGWGGGLDFGYVVVNEDATIVYPFIHAGYYGYSLDYTNNQKDPIPFFEGEPVASNTTATYTGAAPRAAIGIGLNSFVGGDGIGGFLIGARVSYGQMFARPEWEQDGDVVNNGGHTPAYNALTLSLAIGFGGGE